jgi:glutamate formiminotransferase/glutamate formiminotransferase/formiminotetrahydrofolate cyclodeaminase
VALATLLAIPNVSEGRDQSAIDAIGEAFAHGPGEPPVRILDVHADGDHHRSVFTLAGPPAELVDSLLRGAAAAIARIDVMSPAKHGDTRPGQHPHVGALDVAPLVYLHPDARGAACAAALLAADRIGSELDVPVFLYGELSSADPGSTRGRAQLRRGGVLGLAARMTDAQAPLRPDFGPPRMHATAGATLVAARAPLVAFNVQLAAPAGMAQARAIAALIRDGGERGLPGVRALAIELRGGVAQVSTNVERPFEVSLADVVRAVGEHAPLASAELVGLAPAAALEGFPEELPLPGFDRRRHLIENALG